MDQQYGSGRGQQRDFLAEAARLALQMDPISWDFDLSDKEEQDASSTPSTDFQHSGWQYGKDAALASQGTVMRDLLTPEGPQALCSIFPPPPQSAVLEQLPRPTTSSDPREHELLSSSSGSDLEWEPEISTPRATRSSSEEAKLRVREKNKVAQRRWRQKYRDKQEAQQRKLERLQLQLTQGDKERQKLEAHANLLEKALMKMSMEHAEVQTKSNPIFIPSLGWTSFDPKGSIVLSAIFEPPKKLTADEVARISLRDHARLWRGYVVGIRECLQTADESGNLDMKKLKALLDERHGLLSYVAAQNPQVVHRLTRCNLVTDPPELDAAGVNPQFYSNILRKIELTEEQSKALVEYRNLYLLSVGFHSAALARLQGQLVALDPTPQESLRASSYLKWVEASRALQEAVEEIHLTHVRLHFELYHGEHALTHLQAARMLVESFPYLPDLIALVRELANERKAPSAEELLRTGAIAYTEKQGAADVKVSCEPYVPVIDKISDLVKKVRLWDDSPVQSSKTESAPHASASSMTA